MTRLSTTLFFLENSQRTIDISQDHTVLLHIQSNMMKYKTTKKKLKKKQVLISAKKIDVDK